jgi:hypothetical protein
VRAWLRRNRWGLVGLPLAAALMVGANGQRISDFWWHSDLHYASVSGGEGDWLSYSEDFADAAGPGVHSIRFRVTGIERVDSYTDRFGHTTTITNPAYDAWRVHVEAEADPNTVLTGCSLALTEDDGTRYEFAWQADDIDQDILYPCLPRDAYGPSTTVQADVDRQLGGDGTPRPAQWTSDPVVFVAKGARITGVMLWWQPPHYAKVSVRPE